MPGLRSWISDTVQRSQIKYSFNFQNCPFDGQRIDKVCFHTFMQYASLKSHLNVFVCVYAKMSIYRFQLITATIWIAQQQQGYFKPQIAHCLTEAHEKPQSIWFLRFFFVSFFVSRHTHKTSHSIFICMNFNDKLLSLLFLWKNMINFQFSDFLHS